MSNVAPAGKVWVVVHGFDDDDLYEVDASDTAAELAEAKRIFRKQYPSQPIMGAGHVQSRGDADGLEVHHH